MDLVSGFYDFGFRALFIVSLFFFGGGVLGLGILGFLGIFEDLEFFGRAWARFRASGL